MKKSHYRFIIETIGKCINATAKHIHAPNYTALKYTELQGEIDRYIIVVGAFNISLHKLIYQSLKYNYHISTILHHIQGWTLEVLKT